MSMSGSPGAGAADAGRLATGRGTGWASPFSRLAKARRTLRRGEAAFWNGDLAQAEQAGRRIIDRIPASLRAGETEILIAGVELVGRVRREVTDFSGAAELHRQAFALLDTAADNQDLQQHRLAILSRLGETLRLLGQFDEAENLQVQAVSLAEQLRPPDPVLLANAVNGLGIIYKDTGRYTQADNRYRRALQLLEQTLGSNDLHLAAIHHNLAGLAHAQDQFSDGEPHARQALAIRARHEDLTTTGAAADFGVLGALLLGQHRYTEAEDALTKSLAIWEARFGPDHYEVAVAQHNLAAIYVARGEHARALNTLTRVLATKSHILGATHPDVTALRNHIERRSRNPAT